MEKDATLQLYNTVITDNSADVLGGGLWTCSTGILRFMSQMAALSMITMPKPLMEYGTVIRPETIFQTLWARIP